MGYSLRTEKYRYTIWMNDFTTTAPFSANKIYAQELYDLSKDPLEKMNVLNIRIIIEKPQKHSWGLFRFCREKNISI